MNFTEAQLDLDFVRCRRCGVLDRRDWFMPRMICKKCGCRFYVDATLVTDEEKVQVASGWFEDEANK